MAAEALGRECAILYYLLGRPASTSAVALTYCPQTPRISGCCVLHPESEIPSLCRIIQRSAAGEACSDRYAAQQRFSRDWPRASDRVSHGGRRVFVSFWNIARCRAVKHNAERLGRAVMGDGLVITHSHAAEQTTGTPPARRLHPHQLLWTRLQPVNKATGSWLHRHAPGCCWLALKWPIRRRPREGGRNTTE